jgi:hypothetical protein
MCMLIKVEYMEKALILKPNYAPGEIGRSICRQSLHSVMNYRNPGPINKEAG